MYTERASIYVAIPCSLKKGREREKLGMTTLSSYSEFGVTDHRFSVAYSKLFFFEE